jgi:hypothetical protein
MMLVNGKSLTIPRKVTCIMLFQRKKSVQAIPIPLKEPMLQWAKTQLAKVTPGKSAIAFKASMTFGSIAG